jgi:predicted permease
MAAPLGSRAIDWAALVRARAAASGVQLPSATVDELALHLDDVYQAACEQGLSRGAARARALATLDGSGFAVLRHHASRSAHLPEKASLNMIGAIRVALRQFQQHRTFSLVVVLVLGLGTGAATTVFTAVDAVVLRPLPFAAPDRLVTLWDTNVERGLAHDPISPVNFMDYRDLPVFADAAAWWRPGINLTDQGLDPIRVNTIEVSGNVFELLGVRPQIGAGFPERGPLFVQNELIIVISDRLWRSRYGANPAVVGKPLALNGTAYTVVGVMPPKFHYPDDVDVWQRLRWDMRQHSRAAHFMEAVARLKDGTTLDEAQSAVQTLALRLQGEFPNTNKGWATRLIPLLDEQLGYYRPALMVMFGAVGLLLVIGCLNVASLLLTRALARDREIAVRVAMGATPRQLVTQLLAESLVLSTAGAALGLAAAAGLLPLVLNLTPIDIPRLDEARVNLRALGVAAAVVAAATLFFGLLPSLLLLKRQLSTDLKSGERGSSRGARRIYSVLVAGEVALACALLVSSSLLVRTVNHMMETPLGVEADDVVITTVQLETPQSSYADWQAVGELHSQILASIGQQPGVLAVGATNFLPTEVGWRNPFLLDGQPRPARAEDAPQAQLHSASDGYFAAMGATMAAGRAFTPFDGPQSTPVVVVNEALAQRYFPTGNAVGSYIVSFASGIGPLGRSLPHRKQGEHIRFEVIGIVRDIRNAPLGQTVEPALYFSTRQFPFKEQFIAIRAVTPDAGAAAVREALKRVASHVPMARTQTWGERFAGKTAEPRLLMTILVAFGALAAVLAALGVYGLFSWSVALRTRELAIRLTLGAKPAVVGRLVIANSTLLIIAGLTTGLVLVQLAESALARVLFGVTPSDLVSTLAASAVLVVAALIACIPPTLRAMRVDPVEGLRVE